MFEVNTATSAESSFFRLLEPRSTSGSVWSVRLVQSKVRIDGLSQFVGMWSSRELDLSHIVDTAADENALTSVKM
ncbi:hypothetical protein OESDEN_03157 [Oesophagostomum dentatum]|uniref:Uncharacterized protein n=1 Tax=Oesophagostomum dentatum TaxID=61180 RepID=A0A0B1TL90_OESDE|nr:hypothetical protein OESDEN_03157 [Oesophagostomum dentatum]